KLHQAYWKSRGEKGAFAQLNFVRFQGLLIGRGFARDEIDLLKVTAGDRVIGYLYNFFYRGRAYAYQSGFDYALGGQHAKPGLTCHALAIAHYLARGASAYDFLAGDSQYKRS